MSERTKSIHVAIGMFLWGFGLMLIALSCGCVSVSPDGTERTLKSTKVWYASTDAATGGEVSRDSTTMGVSIDPMAWVQTDHDRAEAEIARQAAMRANMDLPDDCEALPKKASVNWTDVGIGIATVLATAGAAWKTHHIVKRRKARKKETV